jgi:hypothetical protein
LASKESKAASELVVLARRRERELDLELRAGGGGFVRVGLGHRVQLGRLPLLAAGAAAAMVAAAAFCGQREVSSQRYDEESHGLKDREGERGG